MVEQHALCVKSRLVNLEQISEFIGEQAHALGMGEDQVFAIQMAVDEACTNSIQHAYNGSEAGEVTVCCYPEDGDLVIKITDFGAPFDPATIPEPDLSLPLEERSIGGLGLFFMRKLMDSVEFTAHPKRGNEVTMRKRFDSTR